jgi:AIPR protein
MGKVRPLQVEQLQAHLLVEFNGLITGLGDTEDKRERNFLSKALAAFVLIHEAGAGKEQAVAASIDGGDDHGIDSVWVSPTEQVWLVQSKYQQDGDGEPKLAEVTAFADGLRDFIAGRFERFNAALGPKLPAVRRAFDSGVVQVHAALVYTGRTFGEDRRRQFDDMQNLYNRDRADQFRFHRYALEHLHETFLSLQAEPEITEEIVLKSYGQIDAPYRAYFGVMDVADIAKLCENRVHALVQRNIRRYQGSSAVNAAIRQTALIEPQHFFYYNNGITFLCDEARRLGFIDPAQRNARLELRRLSIINGAQTAGSIATEPPASYQGSPAQVLVTVICTQGDDGDFPLAVTEYRNRQNALLPLHFAALDANQEELRQTLQASGICYLYKHAADDPAPSERVFTIEEAAQFLACASNNADALAWVILSSKDPESLLDRQQKLDGTPAKDASDSRYGLLFNDALGARMLWRICQVGRHVFGSIQPGLQDRADEEAETLRHSLHLLLHLVFTHTGLREGASLQLSAEELDQLSSASDRLRQALLDSYSAQAWDGKTPAQVFATAEDLKDLKAATLRRLHANSK